VTKLKQQTQPDAGGCRVEDCNAPLFRISVANPAAGLTDEAKATNPARRRRA